MRSRTTALLAAASCLLPAACDGGGGRARGGGGCPDPGDGDIFAKLQAAPGVLWVGEQSTDIPGYRSFFIDLEQPVDHADPAGQRFIQRLALLHRDVSAPLVLAATGYSLFGEHLTEPAELLSANQLLVEQRYFYPSRPEPADWAYLDIRQAAADHHRIVEALRPIYTGKWISTGRSKGGMASVYHRRFHPGDMDGTVAYVAPHSAGLRDPRYATFLETVGTARCRDDLAALQREALLRRPEMIRRMVDAAAQVGLSYDLLGPDAALESTVISLAFSFWQYQDASLCEVVPGADAPDDEVYAFLDRVGLPLLSTDSYILGFEPYHWQAYTQLGTPGLDTSGIDDLLEVDFAALDDLPSIDVDPVFEPDAMADVGAWLSSEGNRILFIYGENDPWTAAAFHLGGATESYQLFVPGGNHRATLLGLSPPDRRIALAALEAWAGVEPRPPPAPRPPPVEAPQRLVSRRADR